MSERVPRTERQGECRQPRDRHSIPLATSPPKPSSLQCKNRRAPPSHHSPPEPLSLMQKSSSPPLTLHASPQLHVFSFSHNSMSHKIYSKVEKPRCIFLCKGDGTVELFLRLFFSFVKIHVNKIIYYNRHLYLKGFVMQIGGHNQSAHPCSRANVGVIWIM